MANTYTIRITLDGSDVKAEAGKVRAAIEAELGRIEVQGAVDISGMIKTLQKDTVAIRKLTAEVQSAVVDMERALSTPITAESERNAKGLLRVWEWVADKLVRHSVIPDMVNAINEWLARIDPDIFGGGVLVAQADTTAQAIVREFQGIAEALKIKEVEEHLYELRFEIEALGSEFNEMALRGSEASRRQVEQFRQAAEAVRRIRGTSPEIEERLSAGYLPKGFGLGNETQFDKSGRGKLAAGEVGETTDQWYRALNTELEVKTRFTKEQQARIESVLGQMAASETQFAALVESLWQRVEQLSQAIAASTDPVAELAELEEVGRVLDTVGGQYTDLVHAQEGLARNLEEVEGFAGIQAAQEQLRLSQEQAASDRVRALELRAEIESKKAVIALAQRGNAEAEQASKIAVATNAEEQKRLTLQERALQKAREAQKIEAARRVTLRQREKSTVAVAEKRVDLKEQERQTKLLGEAQKLAGELGREWSAIQAEMDASGKSLETVTGELKAAKVETAALAKAQAEHERLLAATKQEAQALGIPWADVEQAMQDSGLSLREVQGTLTRVKREMQESRRGARGFSEDLGGAQRNAASLGKAISDARNQYMGITQLAGDAQSAGRTLQQAGTAITGSLVTAGKKYVEFAADAGVAARALDLTTEQTRIFEQSLVEMSGTLGFVTARELVEGATVWAKAIGQTAETQEDMERILQQTLPAEKLAALSGENLGVILEGGAAALRQFNLPITDLERVLGVTNKVAADTIGEFSGLAETYKMIGPLATQLRIPFEDVAAAAGMLAEAGIQGTMAGTGLARSFNDIVKPSQRAKDQLEALFGTTSPFFQGGQFVGLPKMIDMLAASLSGLSDEERATALAQIFDANALRAITPLIEQQIKARESGVNSLRAYSKNLQGVRDDEVEAWAAMREAQEGVIVDMRGGLERLQGDWEHYETSDQRRIDQMKGRWEQLWLTIGSTAVDVALPGVIQIVDKLGEVVQVAQQYPELVKAAAYLGGGMLAAGTLLNLAGSTMRSVVAIQAVVQGLRAWAGKQVTAEARFQAGVVSAAQQFKLIVTSAATQAAATETGGAAAETATEVGGAQVEAGIEIATAKTRAIIDAAAVGRSAGVFVASLAAGAKTFVTGLGAALLSAGGALAAGLGAILGGAIYEGLRGAGIIEGPGLNQFATVLAYEVGKLFGGEGQGLEWAKKIGELTGALDRNTVAQQPAGPSGAYLPTIVKGAEGGTPTGMGDLRAYEAAQQFAAQATEFTTDALYDYNAAMQNTGDAAGPTTEQQRRAVDLYVELLQKQTEAVEDFNASLANALTDLNRDLAQMEADFQRNRLQETRSYQQETAKAVADFQRQQEQALADHQKNMRRMEEDHYLRMWDLTLSRDAAGMYKEQQSYNIQRQRAEEDFSDQQGQRTDEFNRERAERAAQHAQRMVDLQAEYEQQRAARQEEYAAQVAELQRQHDEDMARLNREYFDRINAELGYHRRSQIQQAMYYTAMLQDTRVYLDRNRGLWQQYVASLPVPSRDRYIGVNDPTVGEFQEGGYVPRTGAALVHAGEFVMSPQTTRQLEGVLGGRLTQQNVGGRGGVTVRANFTGMGSGDRSWFEQRLGDFSRELAGMLS